MNPTSATLKEIFSCRSLAKKKKQSKRIKSNTRELFSIIFPHRIVQFELVCKKKKKTFFSKSGRVKSRGETRGEVEIHRNLQTIPQRNEEERNTESNSAGKRLTRRGGGKNDCSLPLFSKTFFSPRSFNFARNPLVPRRIGSPRVQDYTLGATFHNFPSRGSLERQRPEWRAVSPRFKRFQ